MAKDTKKLKRQFTKEYLGGRRKLKDVDKSGNRDFGDTFLGDLIGADGKIGIKKGRPGLRASLKGERREKDDKPKRKVKSPIKKTSPGIIKGDFTRKDDIKVTKLPPKVKYGPPGSARPDPNKPKDPKDKTTEPKQPRHVREKEAFKKFTSKQWEKMSQKERRENDLPVSLISLGAGRYRDFKFKDGKSPLDLMNQLERILGMNKGGMVKKKKPAAKKMMGGGMVKKKKPAAKKMMGGGMAKKSGYMYGGMAKKKKKK